MGDDPRRSHPIRDAASAGGRLMATQETGQADPYPVATPAEPEWLTRKPADARSGESRVRGYESKLIGFAAVVFLGAFFAMVINTTAGVRNLDANLIKVARSFGASDLQLFRTVALPGSVPFILTGLRLGIGHALTGVVVGEAIAAQFGVGQMMFVAGATFQSSKVFAGLMLIAGAGMLMTFTLQWLERRFDAWRPRPN